VVILVLALARCAAPRSSPPADAGDVPQSPSFGTNGAGGFPEDASLGGQARYVLGGCSGGPEASCHAPGTAAADLTLPDTTPSNLIGVPSSEEPAVFRVQPGDPLRSYLYWKIAGAPGIDGGRMPKDAPPLEARSLDAVAAWIEAGAPP
jgi:hypothetical protein